MNIKMKKLMSLLLCFAMLFGMLPVEVFAVETGAETGITAEENVIEVPTESVASDTVVTDSPSEDTPAETQPEAVPAPAEDPARVLYNKLKSFGDYEALRTYFNSMSAEQLEMLKKFFAAQNIDLEEWLNAFRKQEPAAEEPVAAQITEEQPVVEAPVVEEPLTEAPVVEAPVAEVAETDEPVVEEPVVEEPVDEEPVVEAPFVETPAAEESVVEESAVEEPAAEETEKESLELEFDFSVPTVAADNPQMKYYNGNNYVAYDVAMSRTEGHNDSIGSYVASVTLGGMGVDQKNSNNSYGITVDRRGNKTDNRVGKTLSTYYPGLTTNGSNASKTLVITPAAGYYVTQVTVACCDGGKPYNCGTWNEGKQFSQTFNITTGGALSMEMPSYAFGHGSSQSLESRNGEEQYFILIRVAPVPEPLFVAYDCGIMKDVLGDDSIFAKPAEWTAVSNGNNYGTGGSNETRYTQFRYAYERESEVSNWKHVTNTVTEAAKLAAAEKGYYFTGWEVTYYINCDNYSFSQAYSEPTMIGENTDLRLIIHAKLVAQWEPVRMTVQKVVEGLNATQNYSINVLKEDGSTFQTATFTGAGSKGYSPVVAGTYSVTEEGANQSVEVNGKKYTLTTTYSDPVTVTTEAIAAGTQENVTLTVTNIYEEVTTIEVTATKEWDDADNGLDTRPDSVALQLYANGEAYGDPVEVTADSGWSYTWTELDRDATYTVDEVNVPDGYVKVSVTGNVTDGFVITNKYKNSDFSTQFGTLIISGEKIWDDNENEGGIRPASLTVYLKANGSVIAQQTISAQTGWKWSFDLSNGIEGFDAAEFENIEFTIEEDEIANYTQSDATQPTVEFIYPKAEGWTRTTRCSSLDLSVETNEKTVLIAKKGDDFWMWSQSPLAEIERDLIIQSVHAAYNSVPATASSYKYINGLGTSSDVGMIVTEDKVTFSATSNWSWVIHGTYVPGNATSHGGSLTNTVNSTSITVSKVWNDADNQDGIRPNEVTLDLLADGKVVGTATVSEANGWKYEFTDLQEYKNGQKIDYTVNEADVPKGYSVAVTGTQAEGYTVTNTHAPEKTSVSVTKVWNDNNNQDGIRSTEVTIKLLADEVETGKTLVLNEDNQWTGTFEDLAKKANGKDIAYTVAEVNVPAGYTAAVTGTQAEGYTVTNSHAPEKTSVSVTKVWNDNNNQDGIRSTEVTIKLLADEVETGKTLVLNEDNQWTGTFEDLAKKANGKDIAYTVAEVNVPAGYTAAVTGTQAEGYTVTNTHAPEKTSVSGTKTWNDNNNQDGARPESITINLVKNGEVIDSKTVTAADGWAWTFADLDKFENGEVITYSFTENAVEDYSTSYEGNTVINTHTPAQTSVTVTKSWADSNDQDGLRPDFVTITLLANGKETGETLVLNAGNNWTGSFTALDKFAGGKEIAYSVAEVKVEGYETVITGDMTTGYTVTNTHIPAIVEVSGAKTWVDNNNQDGKRPQSITINLLADGVVMETATVTAENGWAWSFEDLPKYKNHGTEIEYTITENEVEGYINEISGYNVTNTHTPEQTSVTVTKSWTDNNDQDGLRPESVTINLLANGTATGKTLVLSKDNGWAGTFADLDKYAAGEEIRYTVEEVAVTGYTTVITGNQAEGYIVTNAHTPATVEVSGSKTWDDANNQDGKRPQSITIKLLANGNVAETKTVTAADGWKWSFTNLPKYENHGALISYTITEDSVDGYTTTYNGYDVTNKYSPEETSVTVSKAWADNNDQDGIRPNDVTIKLLADGKTTGKTLVLNAGNGWTGSFTGLDKYAEGKVIKYTVEELTVAGYTSAITGDQTSGYTVTNTHTPATVEVSGHKIWNDNNNQDGARPRTITINLLANGKVIASRTVTAANGWAWSFAGLPKYENHGVEIVYSITENAVEDYTTTYNGYNVINTHTPEKTSVTVTKSWKDAGDQDGIRPNDVTIKLLANGEATGETLVLNDANGWTGSFTGLDKFAEGEEITYTVEELTVEGYTSVITGSQAVGFTVTNTHEPETLDVSGKKTWDDADDQDGKRPESITIRLLANGVEVDRITVTEAESWAWSFKDLPKYENHGTEITYTITEDSVEGYTASYNGFNVTNKYTPEKTSVTVTKSWQDNNDQDGIRPEKITVNLLANGEKAASVKLTAEDNWTYTFTELDVYAEGEKIVYTVEEEAVEGYETVITGDAAKGFTVTNSHTPETLEVSGKKTWEDDNNRDGKRPESITVRLLANGKEVASATVTAEDAWAFKFTNLPKFEAGEEIVYTVTEDAVEGYSVVYSNKSFDITNKYTPGKTSVTVTKRWIDGSDHDGIRPSSVTIYLYANDVKIAEMKLTAKDNWTGVFDDLHIYENGKRIAYTISEKSVRGYNATFTGSAENGFTVTNTHNIIPKTGDDSNLPLYVSMFGASICALAILMFLAKPKKKGKYAR